MRDFLANPHGQSTRMNGVRRAPVVIDDSVHLAMILSRVFPLAVAVTAAFFAGVLLASAMA